jgi:ElaB/YqjD/DUF883 family membrane-anchored ribosome-binding protein
MTNTENAIPSAETSGDVCSAADALELAKAEFEKAQVFYENVRQQATDRLKSVREASVGDAIDGTLDAVRRHPGTSLTIAAMIGFFIGRLFRR